MCCTSAGWHLFLCEGVGGREGCTLWAPFYLEKLITQSAKLTGKSLLVTGGTGTLGLAILRHLLEHEEFEKIILFSRDEMKQWALRQHFGDEPRLRFFIGDVRDRDRLKRAFAGVDYVVHAAATKIVPAAEYNPFEAVKTNVFGAMNVAEAAVDMGVESVVALSTDKASSPINLYGATKLVADKLFLRSSTYMASELTRFNVLRYGNIIGSRGSLIPSIRGQVLSGKPVEVTDPEMTRFMQKVENAVVAVLGLLVSDSRSETHILKSPSMKVGDIVSILASGSEVRITGERSGEKKHEQMLSEHDVPYSVEMADKFVRYESPDRAATAVAMSLGQGLASGFSYASNSNNAWMTTEELSSYLASLDEKNLLPAPF